MYISSSLTARKTHEAPISHLPTHTNTHTHIVEVIVAAAVSIISFFLNSFSFSAVLFVS